MAAALQFGKIPDEPIAVYHATDAVSKTKLDVFRHNPELYRRRFIAKDIAATEQTDAMLIGSATGTLFLEGQEAYTQRYVVLPEDAPKRPTKKQLSAKSPSLETKQAVEWWDSFEISSIGKDKLTEDQAALVGRMRDSLCRHEAINTLFKNGAPEVTFRIKGPRFAVQVRPDLWCEEGCSITDGYPYIVDLKTIAKLPQDDPDHLAKHIADYGYHRSAYLYPEIVAQALKWKPEVIRPRFFFAFVEKAEPHHVEVVELTSLDVEIGQREVTHSLAGLNRCIETGVWKPATSSVRTVSLPSYYVRRSLENNESLLA